MRFSLYTSTVSHLTPGQVIFQVIRKIYRPRYIKKEAPDVLAEGLLTPPVAKPVSTDGTTFTFLNLKAGFNGWDDTSNGLLWTYNLNYMDFLNQPGIGTDECIAWIDRFIEETGCGSIGLQPYPTALRIINWIKFLREHSEYAAKERLDSLCSQLYLLSRSIERHLAGNHILEDAYALTIGSVYFKDSRLTRKAVRLLKRELDRQILPDGAHFEQSPMYHCIMLDRLLDCINYTHGCLPDSFDRFMRDKAALMTGHLRSIVWKDGSIPLLNDSAYGIAPSASQIIDYAGRLGIESDRTQMVQCGYRKMETPRLEVIADIGNITASYQPGHTHADTFSYEMRLDGAPFIIDTGISTYNKNERRQYERSTIAHNTVTVGGRDSSRVWGGFRVASRAHVRIIRDQANLIEASHDGFGRKHLHTRSFKADTTSLTVTDHCKADLETVSMIHFAPEVRIISVHDNRIETDKALITLEGASHVEVTDVETSVEYNRLRPCKAVAIRFSERLTTVITPL